MKVTARLVTSVDDLSFKESTFTNILSTSNYRKFMEIQVEDTGIGINEED